MKRMAGPKKRDTEFKNFACVYIKFKFGVGRANHDDTKSNKIGQNNKFLKLQSIRLIQKKSLSVPKIAVL